MNLDSFEVINIDTLNLPNRYKKAIKELTQKITQNRAQLDMSKLFLFGSCSRGSIRFNSDIDLLLLTHSLSEKDIRTKIIYNELDDSIYGITPQITVRNINRYNSSKDSIKFHSMIYKDLKLLWRANE